MEDSWITASNNNEPSNEIGIMFNTGAAGTGTPGPVTFYVDTVVYRASAP